MKVYLSHNNEQVPEGYTRVSLSELSQMKDSVDEILGVGVYERAPDVSLLMRVINDALKVGGIAKLVCGYYGFAGSYISPNILRQVSESSLSWCNKAWREANKWVELDCDFDFDVIVACATDIALNLRNEETQNLWRTTRLNCIQSVHFTLTKK